MVEDEILSATRCGFGVVVDGFVDGGRGRNG
jgi:hypothetical protein